jgi:hypothetical protein
MDQPRLRTCLGDARSIGDDSRDDCRIGTNDRLERGFGQPNTALAQRFALECPIVPGRPGPIRLHRWHLAPPVPLVAVDEDALVLPESEQFGGLDPVVFYLIRAGAPSHRPPEDHEASLQPGTPPPIPTAVAEQLGNTRTEAEQDVPDLPGSSQEVRNIRNTPSSADHQANLAELHFRGGAGAFNGGSDAQAMDSALVTSLFHPFSFTPVVDFDEQTGEKALRQ